MENEDTKLTNEPRQNVHWGLGDVVLLFLKCPIVMGALTHTKQSSPQRVLTRHLRTVPDQVAFKYLIPRSWALVYKFHTSFRICVRRWKEKRRGSFDGSIF